MSCTNNLNEWIKTLNTTTLCLEELNKLEKEKKELVTMATSSNPPANILDLLEESKQKFVLLEQRTKELANEMNSIKRKIKSKKAKTK